MGLCLPRRSVAACEASRPSTTSVASITCQARVISPGLGLYVGTDLPRRSQLVCCLSLRPVWGGRPRAGARAAVGSRPRVATRRTSNVEGTRRRRATSNHPPGGGHRALGPGVRQPHPDRQRFAVGGPPAREPRPRLPERAADVAEHADEFRRRDVPLPLAAPVLLRGLPFPGR